MPTLSKVKEVAGLIGDIASTFQKKEYFQFSELEDIVQFLKNAEDEEANSIGEWVFCSITGLMNQ
jgi:hypothetical protein